EILLIYPLLMWKKFLKILAWITGLLVLLALLIFTTVDWSDLKQQEYYHQTLNALEDLQWKGGTKGHLSAGWATINATPKYPQELVGYKPRGEYEFVQDSSSIKSLVLSHGSHAIAFLNYELLIIHPDLAQRLETKILSELPVDMIYFTATHTHSGMGGYMPGLM